MSSVVVVLLIGLCTLALYVAVSLLHGWALARTVHEWEHGLLYIDGRFAGTLEPGSYRVLGFQDRLVVTLPRRPELEHLLNADLTSADRLSYRVSAVPAYEIANPWDAYEGGYREQLRLAVSDDLVRFAAERSLEAVLAERIMLGETMRGAEAQPVCGCRTAASRSAR